MASKLRAAFSSWQMSGSMRHSSVGRYKIIKLFFSEHTHTADDRWVLKDLVMSRHLKIGQLIFSTNSGVIKMFNLVKVKIPKRKCTILDIRLEMEEAISQWNVPG